MCNSPVEPATQDQTSQEAMGAMARLLDIMKKLRDPQTGCPWDLEQTHQSIAPYTIEEAYEVEDALRSGDMDAFKNELGDLLFQTVFQGQLAAEAGTFDFADIANTVSDKMTSRHPHVFGTSDGIDSSEAQTQAWEEQKAKERASKARAKGVRDSVLDDIPTNLPALMRAKKLQKRAARIGFDWPNSAMVLDKIIEECQELEEAASKGEKAAISEEFGDLLFVMVNLGRHFGLEPETVLRDANAKFERRFRYVEDHATQKGVIGDLEKMEMLWQEAKAQE